MGKIGTICDEARETVVRLGSCTVSPAAAQLHIFGVLLGAHVGRIGYVPDADLATLPISVQRDVRELVAQGIWWRDGAGYTIDPVQATRTMRESLSTLNDPRFCVATGSDHVRGGEGTCTRCGGTTFV